MTLWQTETNGDLENTDNARVPWVIWDNQYNHDTLDFQYDSDYQYDPDYQCDPDSNVIRITHTIQITKCDSDYQ